MHKQSKPAPTGIRITEEVINSAIHGIGVLAALVGLIIGLLTFRASGSFTISFVAYVLCLVVLMLMSTLYHALTFTRARGVFRVLDHSGIFLLIAGSFTPFIVMLYDGIMQIILLVVVWLLAVTGITLKATLPVLMSKYGVGIYIALGWMAIVFIPKMSTLSAAIIWLLVVGGVLYTVGALLLAIRKPFIHAAWHVFVLAAAGAHFVAVIKLAAA